MTTTSLGTKRSKVYVVVEDYCTLMSCGNKVTVRGVYLTRESAEAKIRECKKEIKDEWSEIWKYQYAIDESVNDSDEYEIEFFDSRTRYWCQIKELEIQN